MPVALGSNMRYLQNSVITTVSTHNALIFTYCNGVGREATKWKRDGNIEWDRRRATDKTLPRSLERKINEISLLRVWLIWMWGDDNRNERRLFVLIDWNSADKLTIQYVRTNGGQWQRQTDYSSHHYQWPHTTKPMMCAPQLITSHFIICCCCCCGLCFLNGNGQRCVCVCLCKRRCGMSCDLCLSNRKCSETDLNSFKFRWAVRESAQFVFNITTKNIIESPN